MPYVRHIFYIMFSSYNFLLNSILRKLLKVCWISCLRRVGRMPFFLLCCGSFITISMALPSIFEPPTSLNPAFTFRPKKTGGGIICFTALFPTCFSARKWIRLKIHFLFQIPVSREKRPGGIFVKGGKKKWRCVGCKRGVVHLGTDLFIRKIGENCLRMQNVVFLLDPKIS